MKVFSRVILITSVAANLALWSVWRGTDIQPGISPENSIGEPRPNGVKADPAAASRSARPEVSPVVSVPSRGTTWSDLRSDDLATLVARLQAAGFPSDVVRAIVTSMVNERFAAQREQLLGDDENEYWQSGTGLDAEKRASLSRLSREREVLLAQLLGHDAWPADDWTRMYQRRRYGDLPPEKLQRLQTLIADYGELRAQLHAVNRPLNEVDARAQAALEKEWRTDLAKLLSPQELEQYDLRNSPTANQLRHRLDTFRPTEDEYKTLFALQRAQDEQFPPSNASDRQQAGARRIAEAQTQERLKAALGPERYADYQQATNPNYAGINQVVARLDLPLSAAREVIAVQQSINQRAQAVLTSDTLTDQQQTAQLQALASEATGHISAVLTPRGLQLYQQNGGQWLQRLNRPVGTP